MTDKYTLEEIEAAINQMHTETYFSNGKHREHVVNKLRTLLTRTKHKFREGEVVWCEYYEDYFIWPECPDKSREGGLINPRPLSLSEMPLWIEKKLKAADNLAAAAGCVLDGMDGALANLRHRVAKFDAEIEK